MSDICSVTALDIGSTKTCAIIAALDETRKAAVCGYGIAPTSGVTKGVATNLYAVSESVKNALSNAETMANKKADNIFLSISGEHITGLVSKNTYVIPNPGAEVNENDVKRLKDSAGVIVIPPDREIIHQLPMSFAIDGQTGISDPVGMHANRLELDTHIITGLSTFIHNMVKCVHQIGYSVFEVVFSPIADIESILSQSEKELGAALVDIGGGTTDILIVSNNQVKYSASIPVGGKNLTNDISIGLHIEFDAAENIKTNGLHKAEADIPFISEIIESRMSEICMLIADRIESSGYCDEIPAGIVFTGGGSMIRELKSIADSIFALPIRIGKPFGLNGLGSGICTPALSTAAGLILYAGKHYDLSYSANNIVIDVNDIIKRITGYIKKRIL